MTEVVKELERFASGDMILSRGVFDAYEKEPDIPITSSPPPLERVSFTSLSPIEPAVRRLDRPNEGSRGKDNAPRALPTDVPPRGK